MSDEFDDDVAPRPELPKEVADKLHADWGEFHAVETSAGWVAMKCASRTQYDRYQAMIFKEAERPKAGEYIAKACIIYANGTFADSADKDKGQALVRKALDDMFNSRPGIIATCANCALEASGVDTDATVKKYAAS